MELEAVPIPQAPSEPQGLVHSKVPWWAKIAAKIVLSRMASFTRWQKARIFRAGQMQDRKFAESVFNVHLYRADVSDLIGKTVMELGPGNGLTTGQLASERGAEHTWLIDSEPLAAHLTLPPRTTYLSNSPEALLQVPDSSIDFLFSHAVLEHISKKDFRFLLEQTCRVMKPGAVASHSIDFQDHLQYGLNNLRFSERIWESHFMSRSGFYTNRIPWPQMEKIFKDCGFSVQVINFLHWPSLPTPQRKMAEPFRSMPLNELTVKAANIVLRKK